MKENQENSRSGSVNENLHAYYFMSNLFENRFVANDVRLCMSLAQKKFDISAPIFFTDIYSNLISETIKNPDKKIFEYDEAAEFLRGKVPEGGVFLCIFESDEKLVKILELISLCQGASYIMPPVYYPTARYFHRNDIARSVLASDARLDESKFEVADYENILQAIEITKNTPGDYVEIGVYKGRSAHVALSYMESASIERNAWLFDTFEGFDYEQANVSADRIWNKTHNDAPLEKVQKFLSRFENINLQKANVISDDLPAELKSIAVCNLDVDLYEAVIAGLHKVAPLMVSGGIIIIEDQGHTPALGGAYLAVRQFLSSEIAADFMPIHMASGQMFLIRK